MRVVTRLNDDGKQGLDFRQGRQRSSRGSLRR